MVERICIGLILISIGWISLIFSKQLWEMDNSKLGRLRIIIGAFWFIAIVLIGILILFGIGDFLELFERSL